MDTILLYDDKLFRLATPHPPVSTVVKENKIIFYSSLSSPRSCTVFVVMLCHFYSGKSFSLSLSFVTLTFLKEIS